MEVLTGFILLIAFMYVLYILIWKLQEKRKEGCTCGAPYRPDDVLSEDVAEAFGTFGTRKLRVKVRCAACGKIRTFELHVRKKYDSARGESTFPTARQFYENLHR